MSLRPADLQVIPAATVEVARAAFPKGCTAMRLRDELGVVFDEEDFAAAFSGRGRPALSPVRLALVSILQFAEGLSDRQAANAVRARIDWKYALGLELTDPGFDYTVLCEFRARLIDNGLEQRLLDAVLERAAASGLLRAGGRQRTDSTHVLSAIRGLNRLELAAETLRAALNTVAKSAPAWLLEHMPAEWFDRYSVRAEDYRLPKLRAARIELADQIGADGTTLLASITQTARWLENLPEVAALRDVWGQQYERIDGKTRWRHPKDLPPALERLTSPYDLESRTGAKRDKVWEGYKVHLTETCDTDAPHLLTHVATTQATVTDYELTSQIHAGLADRELLPSAHLVDAGYVTAAHLVAARRDHNVELVGPVKVDSRHWLAEEERRGRIHSARLHRRLGKQACELPKRPHQYPVAQRPVPGRTSRGQGPVLRRGLPSLPDAFEVHESTR